MKFPIRHALRFPIRCNGSVRIAAAVIAGLFVAVGASTAQEPPRVESISFSGDPDAGGTYALGEAIAIFVVTEDAVRARGSSLSLSIGERIRTASHALSTPDGRFHFFSYPVQAADLDGDGVDIVRDSLTLAGLDVSHEAVAGGASRRVDGTRTDPPTIEHVGFFSLPQRETNPADRLFSETVYGDTFEAGETIVARVTFSRAVRLTGRPQLKLVVGGVGRQATYSFGTASQRNGAVHFDYVVAPEDVDVDGIAIAANSLTLNGGTITLAGEPAVAADLSHDMVANDEAQKVDGSAASAPRVVGGHYGIFEFSFPEDGETYGRGEVIVLGTRLDRRVEVTGEPRLALEIGDRTRYAPLDTVYSAGSATWLSFEYVVQPDDVDADGLVIPADALRLDQGSLTLAGRPDVQADFPRSDRSFFLRGKVDGGKLVVPSVGTPWFTWGPVRGGTYSLGETITVGLCDPAGVRMSGTPSVSLQVGDRVGQAFLQGAWPISSCHYFGYTVQAEDLDEADGLHVPAGSLSLNGGTVLIAGDPSLAVDVTHDAGVPTGILDRRVDGSQVAPPRVVNVALAGRPSAGAFYGQGSRVAVEVAFDRPIEVQGEPQITLKVGDETRQASLVRHGPRSPRRDHSFQRDEVHFARFEYTVGTGDVDLDGLSVSVDALRLNGGTITLAGAPGVQADLSHSAVNADRTRFVDGGALPGQTSCDPWSPEWPNAVHTFSHGYRVSACVEHTDSSGAVVQRGATDYDLDSEESALLWFFDRDNVEILVKVLDACGVNGHRWVFVAPVTDLAFNLEVEEMSTGRRWRHRNAGGQTARTASDTAAFSCDATAASWADAGVPGLGAVDWPTAGLPAGRGQASATGQETECEADGPALTLAGGYTVSMCYETPEGETGDALDFGLDSSQSGLLYFFDRGNAEVLIKVLDGCGLNGHRWVFVAPVTTLAFNLHVEGPDGQRWSHRNPQGKTADTAKDLTFFPCVAGG